MIDGKLVVVLGIIVVAVVSLVGIFVYVHIEDKVVARLKKEQPTAYQHATLLDRFAGQVLRELMRTSNITVDSSDVDITRMTHGAYRIAQFMIDTRTRPVAFHQPFEWNTRRNDA